MPAAIAAAGTLLLCAACGGTATQPSRAWPANAVELLQQLRQDVAAVESVTPSQRSFVDTGELYVLLVAYSDLGGCSSMAAQTAAPEAVIGVIARACPQLERAAVLFTQAEAASSTRELVHAAREAGLALPALVRALATVSPAHPLR
jgi:hypothetical protein